MTRIFVPFLLLLIRCTLTWSQSPTGFPTATTLNGLSVTAFPTASRLAAASGTSTPLEGSAKATSTQSEAVSMQVDESRCEASGVNIAQHRVVATVDYNAQAVQVQQQVTYTNKSSDTLSMLVFNVEPNRWLGAFSLEGITLGAEKSQPEFALTGRRLDIMLPNILEPNCIVQVNINYRLSVLPIIGGIEAYRGYFGHTIRQLNLGHWLPVPVPYVDGDWLFNETILIGEQLALEQSDWHVAFTVTNAPQGIVIAAPGEREQIAANSWRFVHTNGRDFAASISNAFQLATVESESGIPVDVYAFPDARIWDEAGGQWMDGGKYAAQVGAESINLYSDRYGDYPHERMVIVQGDFPDGMEFSGFAFVSTDWFVRYDGSPAGYLMLITVHEVAHQWWYDLVGNDQANAPYLDEALATYSELVYVEQYYPELVNWWWDFRVMRLEPQGDVDSTVYEFDQIRPYIDAVYLRGVLMLAETRTVLSDEVFFGWLTQYANQLGGSVAMPPDLWSLLTAEQCAATATVRAKYLREQWC